ncbi:DMT family transporter [Nocardia sp. NPDC024068]|uniref:DMT family transporter n=1 Tax=Nocardia sp. NPDC024068 TaxID=3157197 RepID=UPI0033FBFB7A
MNGTGRGLVLLIAATSLWGASSAGIAGVGAAGFAAAPVAAGGGLALLAFTALRGARPWRDFRDAPGLFLRLGALEVLNLVCYVAALHIGPLPVVVALHLTAPVLMIITQILRGRRVVTVAVVAELVAVGAAIWLVAGNQPADTALGPALAGCALAVASAACVAGLITLVVRESADRPSGPAAGLQLLTASVLGAPLLGWAVFAGAGPSAAQSVALAAIGALLLGPGFACYWLALRDLNEVTAGLVGLNEAVVATLAGAAVVGADITGATLLAGALVLGAVGLELGNPGRFRAPS